MVRPHLTTPNLYRITQFKVHDTIKVEFGLFRFRSPLLTKFIFVSIPPGTEMFYFPGCALNSQAI